jgi:hypothetical protein
MRFRSSFCVWCSFSFIHFFSGYRRDMIGVSFFGGSRFRTCLHFRMLLDCQIFGESSFGIWSDESGVVSVLGNFTTAATIIRTHRGIFWRWKGTLSAVSLRESEFSRRVNRRFE